MRSYHYLYAAAFASFLVSCDSQEEAAPSKAQALIELDSGSRRISAPSSPVISPLSSSSIPNALDNLVATMSTELGNMSPGKFSKKLPGVKTRLDTTQKVIALTFDACGGEGGSDYDNGLIDLLRRESAPATLFVTSTWIDGHQSEFLAICQDPLFEIENHGAEHRPLTVGEQMIYGRKGTGSVAAAVREIEANARKIEGLSGRRTQFYRSGTAHYDEGGVQIAYRLRHTPVNFDVLSEDIVKGVSAELIKGNLLRRTRAGSIVIMHMNHPEGNTMEVLAEAIPLLRQRGYTFVQLRDYPLKD